MMSLAKLIKRTSLLPRKMLHVKDELSLIGILNRECAVLSPVIKRAAIPKDATARVISPHDLTFASNVLYKNVFLVPSGPSTKKYLNVCLIASIITSYI